MGRYFSKTAESSGYNLIALLEKRRSIRAFHADAVPQDKIDTILAAGRHAPSGGNRHPWKYVVVQDNAVKKEIRARSEAGDKKWHDNADEKMQKWLRAKHIKTEKKFLTDAPVLIVVFGDRNDPYWRESVWISIGYMLLAAVDQGLGSMIYTPGDPGYLNAVLDVPARYVPLAILPIGCPLVEPQKNPTKQTEMEHRKLTASVVSEPAAPKLRKVSAPENARKTQDESPDILMKERTCACGCNRPIISLNSKRKYIHGHAKFGENGLFEALKSPPLCRCGCGLTTEWDWERMSWKKYIDQHVGIRKGYARAKQRMKNQIDMFK